MLKLRKITKKYYAGDITVDALKGINLEFRKSEFIAILGPSGCGKTTMLNIIGGLDRYTSGDLVIDSISTKKYKDTDWDIYRNNSIGFVFQTYNLIPHQTVLSNVELALTLAGVSSTERKERATKALTQVGLSDQLKKKPNQLSGGQMQRVAIARALVNNPEILLADEPTGALDSETSIQIMEILKEISKDKMVIMVTHNPQLANEYATRIINLSDGQVVGDSMPHDSGPSPQKEKKKRKKISMSFFTALSLSLSNLFTKKGRTIMTALAGSIGIIGIALILSFANGINNYIHNTEEEMLSIYPLSIQNQGMDLTSIFLDMQTDVHGDSDKTVREKGMVGEAGIISNMFSRTGTNDLRSLKAYFESDKSRIKKNVNTIQYSYNVTPQIFTKGKSGSFNKINPDESFSEFGMGGQSSSSILNMWTSSNTFYELIDDHEIFEDQYEVMAGKWPERYNECLLVLTESGKMMDILMYQLGFRDMEKLEKMARQFVNNEDVDTPSDTMSVSFEDIMGKKMNVIPSYKYFKRNDEYNIWEDMSDNEKYMKNVIEQGENLNIVGIVKPTGDASTQALKPGIYYTSALTKHLIDLGAESEIVKQQKKSPKINVFTGKTFKEESEDEESDNALDFSSLMTIDQNKMKQAFSIDQNKLSIDFEKYLRTTNMDFSDVEMDNMSGFQISQSDLISTVDMQKTMAVMNEIVNDYIANPGGMSFSEYVQQPAVQQKIYNGMAGAVDDAKLQSILNHYMQTTMENYVSEITKAVSKQIEDSMTKAMNDFAEAIPAAMSIDPAKFAGAFRFNMDEDELQTLIMSLMTNEKSSFDNNMVKLGYADLDNPYAINIFPKDFESKQNVIDILNSYNERMKESGQKDKVIMFTDFVGTLMSSINRIVNLISYVLIAFVAISLVVSSIMIGIITYVSVLERVKEIGILRSIGASKRDIARVFNAETVIIGFAAGVIAIIVTIGLNLVGSAIVYSNFDVSDIAVLPPLAGPVLVGISVFLTFVAGLIPSGAAARKDPVEALRTE